MAYRADGTPTAYFRGRKLQGKSVKLPEGYRGVIAAVSEAEEPTVQTEVIDLEAETPQGSLQVQAEFDEMLVWGHESAVDASADPYLRGTEEWLALAEKVCWAVFWNLSDVVANDAWQIHSYPAPTSKK